MPEHPLLIFPVPSRAERRSLPPPVGRRPRTPTPREQSERLALKFSRLEEAFARRQAELRGDPSGAEAEQVLVLETIGRVDEFVTALRGISGLEWMGEIDVDDLEPDDHFYRVDDPQKPLSGRLYLVMSNLRGLQELLSLWEIYRAAPEDPRFARGRTKWRDLFNLLREIRPWGPEDRLRETGLLQVWQERVQSAAEQMHVEVELWPRRDPDQRGQAVRTLEQLISHAGGQVLAQTYVQEIHYHAVLAQLPIQSVGDLFSSEHTRLVKCDQVMFFRPTGQAIAPYPDEEALPGPEVDGNLPVPTGEPIVALLDGYPLANHQLLLGRLIVDDPDDWAGDCPATQRRHGTAMASLIVHGELDAPEQPLARPVYVRPILKPLTAFGRASTECIPETVLPIDLVHRAVRRLVEGDGDEPPVAPHVRIINLSVCDVSHAFDRYPTPWARLLDYLAWRYRLLFVVSAGNYQDDVELAIQRTEFDRIRGDSTQLEREVLRAICQQGRLRPLRSPADAINVLTVGAVHGDRSPRNALGNRIDPLQSDGLPSPINAQGPGFRRSVKPDILCPGGRQPYSEKFGTTHERATLVLSTAVAPPGHRVAAPGPTPGDLAKSLYTRGTSNAAAMAARTAVQLYDLLQQLRNEPGGGALDENYTAVLIKALMVHSASWGDAPAVIEPLLGNIQAQWRKVALARLLGYGKIRAERVFECTAQRATLVGCGQLRDGEADVFRLPLPPGLSGKRIRRQLTATLAWLTPINPYHRAYRQAALWFDPYDGTGSGDDIKRLLGVERMEAQWQAVRNGTVQHEIFQGEKATAFVDGDEVVFRVNCRQEGGQLEHPVPYGFIVTIEIAEGVDVHVYNEIRQRIRPAVRVEAT